MLSADSGCQILIHLSSLCLRRFIVSVIHYTLLLDLKMLGTAWLLLCQTFLSLLILEELRLGLSLLHSSCWLWVISLTNWVYLLNSLSAKVTVWCWLLMFLLRFASQYSFILFELAIALGEDIITFVADLCSTLILFTLSVFDIVVESFCSVLFNLL